MRNVRPLRIWATKKTSKDISMPLSCPLPLWRVTVMTVSSSNSITSAISMRKSSHWLGQSSHPRRTASLPT